MLPSGHAKSMGRRSRGLATRSKRGTRERAGLFSQSATFNNRSGFDNVRHRSIHDDKIKQMEIRMKGLVIASALVLGAVLLPTGPAQAKGCIKGAVVGGTAGHFMGHHGILGAMAGCAIGHHHAEARYHNNYNNT